MNTLYFNTNIKQESQKMKEYKERMAAQKLRTANFNKEYSDNCKETTKKNRIDAKLKRDEEKVQYEKRRVLRRDEEKKKDEERKALMSEEEREEEEKKMEKRRIMLKLLIGK